MNAETREKRNVLSELSNSLRPGVEAGIFTTINAALISHYGSIKGNREFNTFKGWKEKACHVKKGAKAFLIWGAPKKYSIDKDAKTEEEKKCSFFPLSYLFSNLQVESN